LVHYERDEFLIFSDLFVPSEIAVLPGGGASVPTKWCASIPAVVNRLFRVHDEDGPVRQAP
jgi:hypothetical protein